MLCIFKPELTGEPICVENGLQGNQPFLVRQPTCPYESSLDVVLGIDSDALSFQNPQQDDGHETEVDNINPSYQNR